MMKLLLLLTFLPFAASAQTYSEFAEELEPWVQKYVTYATGQRFALVEMPVAVRSTGWGCRCPEHYTGVGTTVQEGPFLSLQGLPENFPVSDETGHSLIVTGFFTGKYVTLDLRASEDEPEEWIYTLPVFYVKSWKENTLGYDVPAPHEVNN